MSTIARCLPLWPGGVSGWIAVAMLGMAAGALAADEPRAGAAARMLRLGDQPLFFADDSVLSHHVRVTRTFHPGRTRPQPVLQADQPWEGDRVYLYGTVYWDAPTQRFLMWYMSRSDTPVDAPTLRGGRDLVLLATSSDGVHWTKPALGFHSYNAKRENNILMGLHTPAVIRDGTESDPARRYKLLGYHRGNYYAAHSGDGVHWTPFQEAAVFKGNDTMTLTQDPASGDFLAYFKQRHSDVPGRVVWLTRSRDFVHWTPAQLVFHADGQDHAWSWRPGQRTEVYNMAVFPHAGGFLGWPTILRVVTRAPADAKLPPGQSADDGPIDVQLATSTDGVTWQRPTPRAVMIPRGAPGAFDGGAILGVGTQRIDVGDETWVYYTAINTGHGAPVPPKRISIGRAEWRRHGFVSLDADPAGGEIETVPLQFDAPSLVVNADASRGKLAVALREADGGQIAGFDFAACEPLRADATRWTVRWKNGGAVPTDRPVRVVLAFSGARVFSLEAGAVATSR